MPIVINEIVITTNVEHTPSAQNVPTPNNHTEIGEIVKQSVEKVLEILGEKKQR